ncbi:MAG: 4Fe-4S dicluster domain-containing protein, partial [Candidatus Hodarchaeota archaeon]
MISDAEFTFPFLFQRKFMCPRFTSFPKHFNYGKTPVIMTIDGIDQETCSNCYSCIQVCPATLYKRMEDGSVKFLTNQFCIRCGHCVSACPEDAIIRTDMEDVEDFPVGKNVEDFVEYGDLMNLFRAKRSLRRYKKKKVDDDSLNKIFNAIRYAPSGANSRMWKFVLVSDQKKIE